MALAFVWEKRGQARRSPVGAVVLRPGGASAASCQAPQDPTRRCGPPGTGKAEGPLIASIRDLNAQYHHNEVGQERVATLMWGRSYQMATN
jgi:hypothetical protein